MAATQIRLRGLLIAFAVQAFVLLSSEVAQGQPSASVLKGEKMNLECDDLSSLCFSNRLLEGRPAASSAGAEKESGDESPLSFSSRAGRRMVLARARSSEI